MLSDHQVTSFSALTVDYPGRHGAVCVWGGGGYNRASGVSPEGGGGKNWNFRPTGQARCFSALQALWSDYPGRKVV